MKGRCGVDSKVGVGSRFWIELASAEPTAKNKKQIA
jgi:signal transduction histidine kinase